MVTLRNETNKNFTILNNYILQRTDISLKAVGIYAKLVSLPDNWNFTESGLCSICKDGKDSIKSALNELESIGLLLRFQAKQSGKFSNNIYYIASEPITEEQKKEIMERYVPTSSTVLEDNKENSETLSTAEKPLAENPLTENPLTENPQQLNTNIYNTNIYNNKKKYTKEKFDTFYKAYPRKVGKANVEKWFSKNNPDEKLFATIMKQLMIFKKSPDWLKDNGQFIPYPSTWLNQKRWEDELTCNITLPEEDYSAFKESTMTEEDYIKRAEHGGKKYV